MRHSLLALTVAFALVGCESDPPPAEPEPAAKRDEPGRLSDEHIKYHENHVRSMRINVDLDTVDLADVMEQIGRQVGKTITVDPSVKEDVTVSLRDIPWNEAVDVIARMARCKVEETPEGRHVSYDR